MMRWVPEYGINLDSRNTNSLETSVCHCLAGCFVYLAEYRMVTCGLMIPFDASDLGRCRTWSHRWSLALTDRRWWQACIFI